MNRSQAAMEFMLTYGWAIVVIVAAGGALWHYGLLSTTGLGFMRPSTCTIDIGLSCLDHSVTFEQNEFIPELSTNEFYLVIKNNIGQKLNLETLDIPAFQLDSYPIDEEVNNGDRYVITITDIQDPDVATAFFGKGESYNVKIKLHFVNIDSGLAHDVDVEVTGVTN